MKERDLHSARNEGDGLRSKIQDDERRIRELEEQIQNDDRVDILEAKLRNTQDRAEEVAIQLSRLKQVYTNICIRGWGAQAKYYWTDTRQALG